MLKFLNDNRWNLAASIVWTLNAAIDASSEKYSWTLVDAFLALLFAYVYVRNLPKKEDSNG